MLARVKIFCKKKKSLLWPIMFFYTRWENKRSTQLCQSSHSRHILHANVRFHLGFSLLFCWPHVSLVKKTHFDNFWRLINICLFPTQTPGFYDLKWPLLSKAAAARLALSSQVQLVRTLSHSVFFLFREWPLVFCLWNHLILFLYLILFSIF